MLDQFARIRVVRPSFRGLCHAETQEHATTVYFRLLLHQLFHLLAFYLHLWELQNQGIARSRNAVLYLRRPAYFGISSGNTTFDCIPLTRQAMTLLGGLGVRNDSREDRRSCTCEPADIGSLTWKAESVYSLLAREATALTGGYEVRNDPGGKCDVQHVYTC
jgi:hypothetical protein